MPVSKVIADRFKYSLASILMAWALSGVIGFAAGILAAVKVVHTVCQSILSDTAVCTGVLVRTADVMVFSIYGLHSGAPEIDKLAADVTIWTGSITLYCRL
ncbi:MAG: hypothetical protein V8R14_01105 [Clostridia bacterium]